MREAFDTIFSERNACKRRRHDIDCSHVGLVREKLAEKLVNGGKCESEVYFAFAFNRLNPLTQLQCASAGVFTSRCDRTGTNNESAVPLSHRIQHKHRFDVHVAQSNPKSSQYSARRCATCKLT